MIIELIHTIIKYNVMFPIESNELLKSIIKILFYEMNFTELI